MENNEFKTAAAKLLEQNGVKGPGVEAGRAENAGNAGKVMLAEEQDGAATRPVEAPKYVPVRREKIPMTLPLLISLATTKLSLGLAVVCCALMWLVVPELLISQSFKIVNVVIGIIMGLTYGVILSFPKLEEGGTRL